MTNFFGVKTKRPFLLALSAFFCLLITAFGENLAAQNSQNSQTAPQTLNKVAQSKDTQTNGKMQSHNEATQSVNFQGQNDKIQLKSVNSQKQNAILNSQNANSQAQNENSSPQSANFQPQTTHFTLQNDSKITFKITKLAIFSIMGEFKEFGGALKLDNNGSISGLNIAVVGDSISTGKPKRDKKAKEKYLNVVDYPYIKFSLISYEPKSDEKGVTKGTLLAKLTMHGKSKGVRFESVLDRGSGAPKLTLTGKFNSKDFGVKGRVTSSNTVNLHLQTNWAQTR